MRSNYMAHSIPPLSGFRGNIHSQKRRKAKGFRALYLYYMYFLGIRRPAKKQKAVPFSVRQEVTKLHRYQRQFRLLQTYRIDTGASFPCLWMLYRLKSTH